jgi:hypothetical protein
MLGRKSYTREEIDQARCAVDGQLAGYRDLVRALEGGPAGPDARAAREAFETHFFATLTLALDRYFVHRIRPVTGKDGNPLNEVELIAESLMTNGGVLQTTKVIRYVPAEAVLGLEPGSRIQLTAEDFSRLSAAFFSELERRFLEAA